MSAEPLSRPRGSALAPEELAWPHLAMIDATAPVGVGVGDIDEAERGQRIDQLCERMVAVCESAVDSLEIAAALEFEGMGDRSVRQQYGLPDVFALAAEMYRRVPRRPTEPTPTADPFRTSRWGPILHGIIYGLPAACFPAATGLLAGRGALTVLVASLTMSWALSQGLAYLGFRRLGWTDLDQTKRLLRRGLAVGMASVCIAMVVIALVVPAHLGTLAFGVGQGAYMLGASVLMVLAVERRLFLVLAPSVLSAAVFLALGRPPTLQHGVWVALAATPILAVLLAVMCTRPAGPPKPGRLLVHGELRAALPSAAFGLLAAGLLAFPVAVGSSGHGGANMGALLAALPLSLSMGGAEWCLFWYRRRTQRLLRSTRRLGGFGFRARLALLGAVTQYLIIAAGLTVAVVAVATASRLAHPQWSVWPEVMAYLALGGAMFVCLLLQTFGVRHITLLACAAALGFEFAYRGWGVTAQVLAYLGLFGFLAAYGLVVLGRAAKHAY